MTNAVEGRRPEVVDEGRFLLGTVLLEEDVDCSSHGLRKDLAPRTLRQVDVRDPYVDRYHPREVEAAVAEQLAIDALARARRLAGHWERSPGTAYVDREHETAAKSDVEWGDPVTGKQWLEGLGSPGMTAWQSLIPSALALLHLSDPVGHEHVLVGGEMVPVDAVMRRTLSLYTDPIAIRSRATVMAGLVRQSLESTDDARVRWLSVACGTALPAMQAALLTDSTPELTLVDVDREAMDMASDLAAELGFRGELSQRRINIFDHAQMSALGEELSATGRRPRLVDMMGIFEYTGPRLGVDPALFLQSAYDLLEPDGQLIFGQMRSDRPIPDFVMGVVQWPYIEMRSLEEIMHIVTSIGIRACDVDIFLPSDGVYAVVSIQKSI